MSSKGLPPATTAVLYAAAGVLFIAGALSSARPAFSGVGVAFLVLAALVWMRRRHRQD